MRQRRLRKGGQRVGPEGPRRAHRLVGVKTKKLRRSGKPKWSAGKKTVVILLSVVVLAAAAIGGGYAYLWYRFNQINKVHIADEVAAQSGQPFTILVIGSDTRVGESAAGAQAFGSARQVTGQRSDVVQLWRVTPSTKRSRSCRSRATRWSRMLPPDNSQYGTYNRINSSYNTGANQLVKTITANFGIPINHVVQVDFSGFQDAVNALGGVYMNFPYPAKDAYSGLNITTPGCQLLNGTQALAVARSRHYEYYANGYWQYDGTSDFGRIQRQDVFIKAMMDAAKSKVNPLTVNAFIGSIHEGVTIDDGFGFNELIGLRLNYHSFDPAQLRGQTLPTVSSTAFPGLGDVLTVNQPATQQMLLNIFGSSLETPTNPPPNVNGVPHSHRPITPTTVTPTTATTAASGVTPRQAPARRRRPRRRHRPRSTPRTAAAEPNGPSPPRPQPWGVVLGTVTVVIVAPGGSWKSDAGGDDE